ncbi:MAG: glycine cleavage system protein GcvH [Planctomycetes bacterium]|nr:glycine cleavage system protein GcvH [Planctomycetota bacterium]
MVPEDLFYSKEHEWARAEGSEVTVGITDYAQEQLGEVTFVELPELELKIGQGDVLGAVESSKAASDLYAPVSGRVFEVNDELETKPELVNDDCYGLGWICKIKIAEESGTDGLMSAAQYEQYLKEL